MERLQTASNAKRASDRNRNGRYYFSVTLGGRESGWAVPGGCTYMKFWSIKCSIEHAAEIRIPSWLEIMARSMPRSSDRSICKKSPTLCEMGRNANWHLSLREGSNTVMFGRPAMYLSVTTAKWNRVVGDWLSIWICFDFKIFSPKFEKQCRRIRVSREWSRVSRQGCPLLLISIHNLHNIIVF